MAPLDRVVQSPIFQQTILALIVVNAAVVGLETSPALMRAYGPWILGASDAFQAMFVLEIALRILAHGRRPREFFRDGWNVFDFLIVAGSLLPAAGAYATVARLARVLRVIRVVSVSSDLRLIVTTMLRSIPGMAHVLMLMALLVYVYSVMGYHLYHEIDPGRWGSLGAALLSTFQLLTLDGWVEMQAKVLPERPLAWLYFGSYVIINVFVVVNLFIAVVLNNMERIREEEARAESARSTNSELLEDLRRMRETISALEERLKAGG
ncbi:MAG: ion transporter [Candidatus Sumerlaeia bacterium]|nr:ion transporter [Candidatus Sumerlaeia bacterium]